jgi:hypothetical protein
MADGWQALEMVRLPDIPSLPAWTDDWLKTFVSNSGISIKKMYARLLVHFLDPGYVIFCIGRSKE